MRPVLAKAGGNYFLNQDCVALCVLLYPNQPMVEDVEPDLTESLVLLSDCVVSYTVQTSIKLCQVALRSLRFALFITSFTCEAPFS